LKKDGKNKHSIVSNPYNNEYGQYTYYCHEDSKGDKIEYRNSKLVPLNEARDEEEDDDLDSITTPISTSQMKSEFRDKGFDNDNTRERIYHKILMKCKF
jgi:hypothetical protein